MQAHSHTRRVCHSSLKIYAQILFWKNKTFELTKREREKMHKARSSASTDRHVDKPSRQGGGGGGSAVSNFPDTSLLTEDEYKQDFNHIFNDECKFARMLRKLPRDEDEDKKVQKIAEISTYLDQQENIKVQDFNSDC